MSGLPADLDQRLRAALLRCGPCDSNRNLRAAFTDARIAAWHDFIPEAANRTERIAALLDALLDRANDQGQSALALTVRVFGEHIPHGDSCRQELIALAEEIQSATQSVSDAKRSTSPQQNGAKYTVNINGGQVGAIGDNTHIEGGIHYDQKGQQIETQYNIAGNFYATLDGKQPPPFQLPPQVQHFTNRKDELVQIRENLHPGKVFTLCGPGGIGKTALASEVAWRYRDEIAARFPDGILFHSFYNQPQATQALEAIARSYGEEPRPTPRDAALRVLAGKRALMVLDGTEDADDLRAVLEVTGRCGVLVTSRKPKDAVDTRRDVHPWTWMRR